MKTLNPLSTYADAGRKAARATARRDAALARFQHDWMTRAVRLEKPEHRPACRAAYEEAYREESR